MTTPTIKLLALSLLAMLLSACDGSNGDPDSNAGRESILVNGDFEDGLDPWYTAVHANAYSFSIEIDPEHSRHGQQSVRIHSHGTEPWGGILQRNDNPSREIDSKWRLQVWLRGEGITEAPEVMVVFQGSVADPVGLRADTLFGDFEWTRVDLDFDAPKDAGRIEVGFLHHGLGSLWVDNASLVEITH